MGYLDRKVKRQCAEPPHAVKCSPLQLPGDGDTISPLISLLRCFHQENAVREPVPDTALSDKLSKDRLDSWKEIAAYLGRDVTTVQRWEKREGMPVHRHVHDKVGSVYTSRSELDAWTRSRSPLTTKGNGNDAS